MHKVSEPPLRERERTGDLAELCREGTLMFMCFGEHLSAGQEAGKVPEGGGNRWKDGSERGRSGTPLATQGVPNSWNFGYSD